MAKMHMTDNGLRKCTAKTPATCTAQYQGEKSEHFETEAEIAAGEKKWHAEMQAKNNKDALRKNRLYKHNQQIKRMKEEETKEVDERAKSDSATAPTRYFERNGDKVRFPNPKDVNKEEYERAKVFIKDSVDKKFEKNPYRSDVVIEDYRGHAFSVPAFQRDPKSGNYLVVEHRFHVPMVMKVSKSFDEVADYAVKEYGYNDDERVQEDVENYM